MRLAAALMVTLALLSGCATPTFETRERDQSYAQSTRALDVFIVQSPSNDVALAQAHLDKLEWYDQTAKRMAENLRHNGIESNGVGVPNEVALYGAYRARASTAPALIIRVHSYAMRDGFIYALRMHADYLVPGKYAPVWRGATGVSIYSAGDQLAVDALNELSKQGLVSMNHPPPAETTDGKKNATVGGLLVR